MSSCHRRGPETCLSVIIDILGQLHGALPEARSVLLCFLFCKLTNSLFSLLYKQLFVTVDLGTVLITSVDLFPHSLNTQ